VDADTVRDWLVPVSTAVSVFATACGILVAVWGYRLKTQAEARLAESARVEADIKLVKLFVEVMDVAHARGQSVVVSDKLFEAMVPHLPVKDIDHLKKAAVITFPIGTAAQDAAIAAIAVLGKQHSILLKIADQALESLKPIKGQVAQPHLESLRKAGADDIKK
jgi:hypothetical protein